MSNGRGSAPTTKASLSDIGTRLLARFRRSDVAQRLLRLTGWTLLAFALEKAASVAVLLLLAGVLGAADYGRLTLSQGMVNALQMLIIVGAGPVLNRYIPEFRKQGFQRAVQLINLCLCLAGGLAAVFLTVTLITGRPAMAGALAVADGSILLSLIIAWVLVSTGVNLAAATLLSFEQGRSLGLVSGLGATAMVTAVPWLALHRGLEGAVAGLLMVEAVKLVGLTLAYLRMAARERCTILTAPQPADLALIARFGLPVFLSGALWAPTLWAAQLIISMGAPNGLAQVGVFGFANSLLGAVILLSSLTNRAAVPILSSMQAEGRSSEMRRLCGRLAMGQLAVASVVAIPLALAAPWVMQLAGPAFAPDWPVLVIMSVTGVVLSAQTALGNYLLVTGRQVYLLVTLMAWGGVLLMLTWVFRDWGAYALAGGLLAASALRTALILKRFARAQPSG